MDGHDFMPKVSIGIPVYNGELTLRKAIDSILAQDFTDFEIIISDNASTDTTQSICAEFVARDSRIRYFRQTKNIGAYKNLRFVLDNARGIYFMWAAADDYRAPDCLSFYVKNIGNAGGVFSTFQAVDSVTGDTATPSIPVLSFQQSSSVAIRSFLSRHCTSMFYGLYRTTVAKECMPNQAFDWCDSIFLLRVISRYKFITAGGPPRYFAGYSVKYKPKPCNGRYVKTGIFFRLAMPLVIHAGPRALISMLYVLRVSTKINIKLTIDWLSAVRRKKQRIY